MFIKRLFPFLFLLCCSIAAIAQNHSQAFDYGQVSGNTYTNNFFGFKVAIPEGWSVKTEEQKKEILDLGSQLMAGDDATMKALVKAAEVKTANLLFISQYEQGAPVDFNPSFGLVAENLTNSPGIKSGNDYLFHAKKFLANSQVKYTFEKEVYNKKIGNQDFAILETSVAFPTGKIRQDYYVTVKNNYSLIFMATFGTKENKKELDKVLKSIEFR
ncbi:MAG TPA: hypothetical protein VK927_06035 [Adhaeribacter sp.]|nr:hypothetical protein [Adhaeribacter sp.]